MRMTRLSRCIAAAVLLTVTTSVPGPRLAAAPVMASDRVSPPVIEGDVRPSGMYEQAMAHAGDELSFEPGDRVSVGFRPRSTDSWPVGGKAPRALPAGNADGEQMQDSEQGDVWAGAPPPEVIRAFERAAPVDGPMIDPTLVLRATETASVATPQTLQTSNASSSLQREVFGFLPYWEVSDASTVLDYRVLSTIAYFSVGSDTAGNLLKTSGGSPTTGWGGWTSDRMTNVINQAHAAGTRVVLTISMFAWTTSQANAQAALLGSATARQNLARQAAAAVRDRGADGINLDFEPIVSGHAGGFTSLVRAVRSELDLIAPGYQLTFDTTGWIGNYPLEAATAPGGADAIFVMGYDYRGSSANPVGSIAPLTGPTYSITDTIRAYTARVSPSKLILGVPYYGRAWSTDTDQVNARNISGTQYGTSATVFYSTAIGFLEQYGRRWDARDQVAWTAYPRQTCSSTYGCATSWRQLYLDDRQALEAKYDLVNREGLRGVGIWALGYDDRRPELNEALAAKFLTDSTASIAAVSPLAPTQRDAGFVVSWTGTAATGVASYDVQVSIGGGPWEAWLDATTATSEVWLGVNGTRYAFRVRARDAAASVSAWDDPTVVSAATSLAPGGFGQVVPSSLSLRSNPTTSASQLRSLMAGDTVAILAGPVSANGYAWYQVSGPLSDSLAVTFASSVGWVAATGGPAAFLVPRLARSATVVDAGLAGYDVGTRRVVSPNGDGLDDLVRLTWRNKTALSSLILTTYRADGALIGSQSLSQLASGPQSLAWGGVAGPSGSSLVPEGTYILQLTGVAAGTTYAAPSVRPVTAAQVARFGITVDRRAAERGTVGRLSGVDRYGIAPAVSAVTYAPGVPVAYVATGLGFADALAGAAPAGYQGGPLLLVPGTSISASVAAELSRLQPARIVVLGGTGAVSEAVAQALQAYTAGPVERAAGPNRYATAAAVSAVTYAPGVPVAYIATGLGYADALAGAAAAGYEGGPILLVPGTSIPAVVAAELSRLQPARIVVLGGTGVVSAAVALALQAYTAGPVDRAAGPNRYATAAAISAATYAPGVPVVYVATGLGDADALAAAAPASYQGGPLLLVPGTSIPAVVAAELSRLQPARIVVLGGTSVVSEAVLAALRSFVR